MSRNVVLIKHSRYWRVFYLKFWYNVLPISLFSLKKNPKISTSHIDNVFFVSKTSLVFKKYPKISTGVNPEILIQCRPNIFALFKKPKILTSKSLPLGFGVKNMVLMKYPKILTGAKPKISIRCKPNIFVPFKSPKILTSKIGHGFFCLFFFCVCQKHGSYEIPQDFDRCFTWHFEKL